MSRCVVVGGADIKEYETVKSMLCKDDYVVFCDCGLRHIEGLGVKPRLIVGDFDSYDNPQMEGVETIVLPCEKDDTDTVYAVKEALKRGFNEFLLIGMIGARLDHTLGNVSILLKLDSLGIKAQIVDDYSDMEIVSNKPVSIPDSYSYFSLLNISGIAEQVSIRDAKYPLENAVIDCEYQYGISNEILPGKTAIVSVGKGRLLLIKDR